MCWAVLYIKQVDWLIQLPFRKWVWKWKRYKHIDETPKSIYSISQKFEHINEKVSTATVSVKERATRMFITFIYVGFTLVSLDKLVPAPKCDNVLYFLLFLCEFVTIFKYCRFFCFFDSSKCTKPDYWVL